MGRVVDSASGERGQILPPPPGSQLARYIQKISRDMFCMFSKPQITYPVHPRASDTEHVHRLSLSFKLFAQIGCKQAKLTALFGVF